MNEGIAITYQNTSIFYDRDFHGKKFPLGGNFFPFINTKKSAFYNDYSGPPIIQDDYLPRILAGILH